MDGLPKTGDYVMLRALTDLVCISTACPCDIDAANGWNLTDIRGPQKTEDFKRSIGWRKTPGLIWKKRKNRLSRRFCTTYSPPCRIRWIRLAHEMTNHGAIEEYGNARKSGYHGISPLRNTKSLVQTLRL